MKLIYLGFIYGIFRGRTLLLAIILDDAGELAQKASLGSGKILPVAAISHRSCGNRHSQERHSRAAIRICRQNAGNSCSRIDYCEDLADSTLDLEVCDAVDQVSEEDALSKNIAAIKHKLATADRATFERAVAEFKAYQLAEMRRASDAVIPDTLYGLAGAGQATFARDNFNKLLAVTSVSGELTPATSESYRRADASFVAGLSRRSRAADQRAAGR